ncbi:MAG: hypothetical protein WC551_02520 [Patescibacteria group bacterium]
MNYKGVLIKESLKDPTILASLNVLNSVTEPVVETDQTPWLDFWTLVMIEIPEAEIEQTAEKISRALDSDRTNWYADFKNDAWHYIVFSGKVFKVDLKDPDQYKAVKDYGRSFGIPEHQLDFASDV